MRRVQADGMGVLRGAVTDGARRRFLHQRWRGEVGLADVQEDHRPVGVRDFARQLLGGLGHLHHIEGLDAFGAGRDLHLF
jgi:hypothetical protein